jgi:aspartate kinase
MQRQEEQLMGIIVQKYGGTSVGTPERIKNVAERVKKSVNAGNQLVVVVSAMGKTTDELIDLARAVTNQPNEREMDMLLTTGEQISIALLSMALQAIGVPAISMTGWQAGILTEAVHGKARIRQIDPNPIRNELRKGKVVVVAGFQGITEHGDITTLGRGGSDTTAVAIAASLQAERCEIYTDVEGVYTTDPRIVREARKLKTISYDEMLELANLGAGVLHPRSVECGKRFQVPILVGSSFVEEEGTLVTEGNQMILESGLLVTGVAYDDEVAKITVEDLPNKVTTLSNLFGVLAKMHINVDIIINSSANTERTTVSFTVSSGDLEKTLLILEEKRDELGYTRLYHEENLAKVSIVGSGMISNPGVAAQMFLLLSEANIEVKMVSTSEIKVSTVVDRQAGERAVQILHEGFKLDQVNQPLEDKMTFTSI